VPRGVEVTTANVHDAAELAAVLPEAPGRVYADSAFSGRKAEDAIRTRGGVPWTTTTRMTARSPERPSGRQRRYRHIMLQTVIQACRCRQP
jgi:IS5 family transposase